MSKVDSLLAHPDIARLRAALHARINDAPDEEGVRRAAVAIVFRSSPEDELPELLFIKRADYPGDPWSGQVAFPGGREEPGDKSLADTAIRETREETGLDLDRDGMVVGALDGFRPRTPGLPHIIVRPFVAVLDREEPMELSAEVAAAFWIPLAALRSTDSWQDTTVFARGVQINARAFRHEGHVIWGMTERILGQLLALL
ncbi:MAG TPA: CoA pyrophosphatase [Gemmatimonadaceae bacterium]|nr:CoA pyrophosphatase [Gemmatimonadaceae bacterium]